MPAIPIGLQLYSVRESCAKDLPGTLRNIAKMGYQGVEFAGFYGYSATDLRNMLDDNGLLCCGAHVPLDQFNEAALDRTVEFHHTLGNPFLIVPGLPEERRNSRHAWMDTAGLFNGWAELLKPHGLATGYHNHHIEFTPLDGKIPWDVFFGYTIEEVIMQLDTGNAMVGGADPLVYLEKYPGRAVTVHLKEYSATNDRAVIGEGDVPWKEVFRLCETVGGTRWYIVEQETYAHPPLECVDLCLKNLRSLLA